MSSLVNGQGVTRAQVVAEVRSWVGTPFVHQACLKGVGADCAGLIRGVFLALGLVPVDYERHLPEGAFAYARRPDGVTMRRYCEEQLVQSVTPFPGDVALIEFVGRPHHLAFYGDHLRGGLSLMHALGPRDPARVIEHRLDDSWTRRIVGCFSIPGIGD